MKPEDYHFRDFDHLDRRSPIIERYAGGLMLQFDYQRTLINTFYPPFENFNYVQHVQEVPVESEGKTEEQDVSFMIFNAEDLIKELLGHHFSEYKRQYPDEIEVEEYFDNEREKLDKALNRLDEPDEVEDDELDEDDDDDWFRWGED
jgi:hypothetical protein